MFSNKSKLKGEQNANTNINTRRSQGYSMSII